MVFAVWAVVNAGTIPQISVFDPFPYPLLATFTSLEAVLLTFRADEAEPNERHR